MSTPLKHLSIEVGDDTNAELVESITLEHLSDLGEGVKEVVENFIRLNEGTVLPPVCIAVKETPASGEEKLSAHS